jgi:hypothetical protein
MGFSDVGLGKICKRYNIPRPGLGYWTRKMHGYHPKQTPLPDMEGEIIIEIHPFKKQDCLLDPNQAREAAQKSASEREAANRIIVPEKIVGPHPLVTRTEKSLRESKPDDRGVIRAHGQGTLSVIVGPASINRAIRILDTLIKALDDRGFKVRVVDDGHEYSHSPGYGPHNWPNYFRGRTRTVISVLGEEVEISLEEHAKRKDHELTSKEKEELRKHGRLFFAPKYDFFPSGCLTLRIKNASSGRVRQTWSDTNHHRLEDLLNSFVIGLTNAATGLRASRLKREREAREREERQKKAEERARLRRAEEQRLNVLESQVANWHKSQIIRQFVDAVRESVLKKNGSIEPDSELDKWISWTIQQADHFDPLVKSPPSILDEPEPSEW